MLNLGLCINLILTGLLYADRKSVHWQDIKKVN